MHGHCGAHQGLANALQGGGTGGPTSTETSCSSGPGGRGKRFDLILEGSGLIGSGVLFIIAVISKGGMGMGDIKLGAFIGIIVGYRNAGVFLLVSIIIGGVVATGLVIGKKRDARNRCRLPLFWL